MDISYSIRFCNPVWIFLIALLVFSACQNSTTSEKEEKKQPTPNTPESVARQWQQYIDYNNFDAAKKLSTNNGIIWIDGIKSILLNVEEGEEAITPTEFTVMTCKEDKDKATCNYVYREEEEIIIDSFFLVRQNGQWLVDIPEEENTM